MNQRIQLNLRLDKDPDLYERLKISAKEEGTTLNNFAINALRKALGLNAGYNTPVTEAIQRIQLLEQQMQEVLERLQTDSNG